VLPITLTTQKEMKSNTVLNNIVENEGLIIHKKEVLFYKTIREQVILSTLDKKMSDLTQTHKCTLIFNEKENLIYF
jgi:hypothetical protein